MGGLSAIVNAFLLLTISDFSVVAVEEENGDVKSLKLDQGGLMANTVVKILGSLLCVYWGYSGMKTFYPIIKDLHRQ